MRHFNTEDGRKKQHFQHIMLYFIKKGKNASEAHTQKDLCGVWRRRCDWLNVSKVVGRVLCWRFLTGWHSTVKYTSEVDSSQIKTIMESNECYINRRQLTDSKYTNQALKIICNSLVMLKWSESHSVMSDSLQPHGDSSGKNTGVGCHSLLQGIFPT